MAKEKQYVFSARTTEEGLKALNEVKARLKVSWDELVIDAVQRSRNAPHQRHRCFTGIVGRMRRQRHIRHAR